VRIFGAGAAAVAVLLFAGCGASDNTSAKSPAETLRAWSNISIRLGSIHSGRSAIRSAWRAATLTS